MALARWQRTIVDNAGNILPGAQVTVRREVSGAPLAVLYSDRDGAVPLGNPFTADAVTAFAAFHAAGGAHRIDVVSGAFSQTLRYVAIGLLGESDSLSDMSVTAAGSTTARLLSERFAETFNIRDFGAVGDGVTDDTDAILAALDAVPAEGAAVVVPIGSHLFTETLLMKSKTTLIGRGWGSILLGENLPLIEGARRIGIRESSASNVDMAILNLCVDISALDGLSAGHKAIQFNDSTRTRVENNRIRTTGTGIAHVNCSQYDVLNNMIEVTVASGTADGVIDQWWGSHSGRIIGNLIEGNDGGRHGILATGTDTGASLSTPCYDLTIANNIVKNCDQIGIWLQGHNGGIHSSIVIGNIVDTVENFHGIRLSDVDSVIVKGNHISNCEHNGIECFDEIASALTNSIIEGNIIEDVNQAGATDNTGAGIRVQGPSSGNRITGNSVLGTTHRRGIALESGADSTDVIGNTIAAGTGSPAYIQDLGASNRIALNRGPSGQAPTRILAQSAAAVSHTGNTSETTLATVTIPANSMGPNGAIRITSLWSMTGTNTKTLRERFGGTSFLNITHTTNLSYSDQRTIANRNSASSQVGPHINAPSGGYGSSASAITTAAVDTASDVSLTFTAQLTNSGESVTLERYTVELINGT